MTQATAIFISGIFIALSLYFAAPRYDFLTANSTNPAVWRLDRYSGDVYLCATATGKDTESGCSIRLKQF